MSGVLQTLEQNIQMVALLQEQLPVEEASELESSSPIADESVS
jgi:hypothetical protein